jgi:NAD(P)-dependent dehydrogenase (short-subunit alcohol dehydrogenase family)
VKGAVIQMTRAMARDLADSGVRAVCVSPGIVRTDFHRNMSAAQKRLNEEQRIPLHREGRPEEVAQLIAALVEVDYVTGENVTTDGTARDGKVMFIPHLLVREVSLTQSGAVGRVNVTVRIAEAG